AELDDYFAENPAYKVAYDMLPYGKFEPPVPGYDFVRDIAEEAMAAIADGADVKSTLDALNEEANEILATQLTSPLPTPVPTDTPEPPAPEIGTEDNPIKVLFVPSVDVDEIIAGGELLAQTLNEATGLVFEVVVPTSYAATLEEICASPDNTMGFIPGLGYVLSNQLCGVDVSAKAVRFGYDWYAAQILVPRDSDIQTLDDLNGLKWAYPDAASTSGYMYPFFMLTQAGVEWGETLEAGGHSASVRAIYNGEADFATSFYSPYIDNETREPIVWLPGEPADIPDEFIDDCGLDDAGQLVCGPWQVRDARRNIREEAPDVMQKVRILDTTSQITNDTVSFGPEFPEDVRAAIMEALFAFAQDDPEGFATAMDAYSWTSVNPATDEEYDDIRLAVEAAGFALEDLVE
ncbi:MAG: PhnD/SsuA/transferrin family substrate-binding protein, partial [Anaerolineales bacterium]|nr:PhnD/SsuA/transferrin family substrate-binding protein [Anaerolineales bacterium]